MGSQVILFDFVIFFTSLILLELSVSPCDNRVYFPKIINVDIMSSLLTIGVSVKLVSIRECKIDDQNGELDVRERCYDQRTLICKTP